MSTAALKMPVEQPKTLSIVEAAQPAIEQPSIDAHPLAPIIAAFALAFFGAVTFVGFFAAWVYFLRDSGVMAP
jgi:hypothetical protein